MSLLFVCLSFRSSLVGSPPRKLLTTWLQDLIWARHCEMMVHYPQPQLMHLIYQKTARFNDLHQKTQECVLVFGVQGSQPMNGATSLSPASSRLPCTYCAANSVYLNSLVSLCLSVVGCLIECTSQHQLPNFKRWVDITDTIWQEDYCLDMGIIHHVLLQGMAPARFRFSYTDFEVFWKCLECTFQEREFCCDVTSCTRFMWVAKARLQRVQEDSKRFIKNSDICKGMMPRLTTKHGTGGAAVRAEAGTCIVQRLHRKFEGNCLKHEGNIFATLAGK